MVAIISLSIALAMDAFACSIAQSCTINNHSRFKLALALGLTFGLFQGIMPLLGYLLGTSFTQLFTNIDHWIAFVLLTLIALNMLREAFSKDDNPIIRISLKDLVVLGIATSIDAFAVGISLPLLNMPIIVSCLSIGIVTFILSFTGVFIGHFLGKHFTKISQILGSITLFVIGSKILIEHMFL